MELKEVMFVEQVSGDRVPSGYYKKSEVDAYIQELEEKHQMEVENNRSAIAPIFSG